MFWCIKAVAWLLFGKNSNLQTVKRFSVNLVSVLESYTITSNFYDSFIKCTLKLNKVIFILTSIIINSHVTLFAMNTFGHPILY